MVLKEDFIALAGNVTVVWDLFRNVGMTLAFK